MALQRCGNKGNETTTHRGINDLFTLFWGIQGCKAAVQQNFTGTGPDTCEAILRLIPARILRHGRTGYLKL